MKRVELNKLNRKLYTLNFGTHTIPPMDQKISKKRMRFNYKKYKISPNEKGDMFLQILKFVEQCPTLAELVDITLDNYITIAANNCGYNVTAEDLIVNYVHSFFLKAKPDKSQEENPNWREVTTVVIADNYWKAMKVEIATLKSMGDWEIIYQDESIIVIDLTWVFNCKRYPD